jgi:hypothetical protein
MFFNDPKHVFYNSYLTEKRKNRKDGKIERKREREREMERKRVCVCKKRRETKIDRERLRWSVS